MYSESDIDGAVDAGALSAQAAADFRGWVARERATPAADEESFRLLTGFNDIFVSIAASLLLVAMGWIGHSIRIGATSEHGPTPAMGFLIAATAWGLAEYFTRTRRMALPSIILLVAFAGGLLLGFGTMLIPSEVELAQDRMSAVMLALSGALTAGGVWLHWRRFRVPITIAVGVATLSAVVIGLLLAAVPQLSDHVTAIIFVCGVGVFALAMWWDMSDTRRQTRRADVAFWLHLLAAPMIVHPVFAMMGLLHGAETTPGQGGVVVALYLVLGFVALAIDRRALMVSALAYVLFALSSLFQQAGAVDMAFGFTALIIGSALLLLSAFWQVARRFVVGLLPGGVAVRLPAPERLATA
ncbi:hypothetical protein [Sphingomonas montanisoli]|uniref:DUF2157 domain-containing protein n=1 Tax=Sphingomonas montanisoli TaxID=2606412 RepID=A0A5D9CBX8_9SPHN|nr:hypothetical protein [Sphingomonas montanisoli]TZG28743.1 hypothetical protein FYJ91_00930 [Sphingomonas montanisoli]